MIESFRHKGLETAFRRRQRQGRERRACPQAQADFGLVGSGGQDVADLDVVTFRLHALKGDLKGFWAVTVRANWRIVFRFEDGNAFDVDFVDYH